MSAAIILSLVGLAVGLIGLVAMIIFIFASKPVDPGQGLTEMLTGDQRQADVIQLWPRAE